MNSMSYRSFLRKFSTSESTSHFRPSVFFNKSEFVDLARRLSMIPSPFSDKREEEPLIEDFIHKNIQKGESIVFVWFQ